MRPLEDPYEATIVAIASHAVDADPTDLLRAELVTLFASGNRYNRYEPTTREKPLEVRTPTVYSSLGLSCELTW